MSYMNNIRGSFLLFFTFFNCHFIDELIHFFSGEEDF